MTAKQALITLWAIFSTTAIILLGIEVYVPGKGFAPTLGTGREVAPSPMSSVADVLDEAMPAVVNITALSYRQGANQIPAYQFGEQNGDDKSKNLGSGVIVDAKQGLILTSYHVIQDAQEIQVVLSDERGYAAQIIGSDPATDVAVIQIKATNLTELKLATERRMKVGDFVVAIGNPFGLRHTVTWGIVSALGRYGIGDGVENFIQTDAPINPGNSGGALINTNGELVGLNTSIYTETGGSVGIGFAIPAKLAADVIAQILQYGEVHRSRFGISVEPITPQVFQRYNVRVMSGAVVTEIEPGSFAHKLGIQAGDVIRRINGRTIHSTQAVKNTAGLLLPGDEFSIDILRGVRPLSFRGSLPELQEQLQRHTSFHPKLAGAQFAELWVEDNGSKRSVGIQLTAVQLGTPAWHAKLKEGDVILAVNGKPVSRLTQLSRELAKARGKLKLTVASGRVKYNVTIR